MANVAQIFHSLPGKWEFDRNLFEKGRAHGTATFECPEDDPNTLHYRENGTWTTPDAKEHPIHREYTYRFKEDKISVYFEEKGEQLLHTLDFSDSKCARGLYSSNHWRNTATYVFSDRDRFELKYSIDGPGKGHFIHTIFKRHI